MTTTTEDPYKDIFDGIEYSTVQTFFADYNPPAEMIEEIAALYNNHKLGCFDSSKLSIALIKTFLEVLRKFNLEFATEILTKFNEESFKIVWTVALCTHLSYIEDKDAYEKTLADASDILFYKYTWITKKESQTLFTQLLDSSRNYRFTQGVKDIHEAGITLYDALQKKQPFSMSVSFVSLMLVLIGKHCWPCTKYSKEFASKLFAVPWEDVDHLQLFSYVQNYTSRLLEEVLVIFPPIDRFIFEQSVQFESL